MKRWRWISATILSGLLFALTPFNIQAEDGDELEYAYGTVKSISSKQLSVMEYDSELDEEVEHLFQIDPKVSLENTKSIKEIAIGKQVNVGYMEKQGKKVAMSIELDDGNYENNVEDGTERAGYHEYENIDTVE